jgi:hypothetical protein
MSGVFNPSSSFTGGKKLDIFLGGKATLFMVRFSWFMARLICCVL